MGRAKRNPSLLPPRKEKRWVSLRSTRPTKLPKVGDAIHLQGWSIEVLDLDGRRIDKILASRIE
jgi:putative hemolysin